MEPNLSHKVNNSPPNNIFGKLLGAMEKEISQLDLKTTNAGCFSNSKIEHRLLKARELAQRTRNINDYATTTYRLKPLDQKVRSI